MCGPSDIVAGRMRYQRFHPAQFLSKCAHCLSLIVGGLSDTPLCVSACNAVHVCVRTYVRATRYRAWLHAWHMHACVCAFNYVMITCANQIHDVLVYDTLPVGILVTEHFENLENVQYMSLFRWFALSASVIH